MDFENYFRRASINDIFFEDQVELFSLRLKDRSWRFARKIFGKWGIFLNGQSVCRTSEQIENTLIYCGVFFSEKIERENFFSYINIRDVFIPTKGNRFLGLKRLETDNGRPEYLISIESL